MNKTYEPYGKKTSVISHLEIIEKAEPEMAQAIVMVINHIYDTYSDKYVKGVKHGIDTKTQLYSPNGNCINVYQVTRYLQRYITEGSNKSGLLIDLFKGIHYMLFEVVRRIKNGNTEIKEWNYEKND
jgi:hypothetical protein